MFDGYAFDAGTLCKDDFIPAEVGIGWRHVAEAFVVTRVIIMLDEGLDLGFELAEQKIAFQ